MKRSMADSIWLFKTFLHNVEKWPNILFKIFTVCWPFFNSMYEKFSCQNISLKLLRKRICGCYFWKIATFLLQQQLGNTSEVATHSCSVKKLVWKNKCEQMLHENTFGWFLQLCQKKRIQYRCFHVNFSECFRTSFFQNSQGLLLV